MPGCRRRSGSSASMRSTRRTTRASTPNWTRRDAGRPTLLVMMHSFTPAMNGMQRPWHAGVLYH
jgi:predicted N-formylglutamate amidohydrolase